MTIVYLILIFLTIAFALFFVIKSVDFRKFLTGAFFVSGGIQLYLAYAKVSIPVLRTSIFQTSEVGYARGVMHLVLCLLCFYFSFIKRKRVNEKEKTQH